MVLMIASTYGEVDLLPGQLAIGAWFLVPNVVCYYGTRPASGAAAWMPCLILILLQTWMVVDFVRFPDSTAPLILIVGPGYLLLLLGAYLGFLWTVRKERARARDGGSQ